jgi:hypothetical protein
MGSRVERLSDIQCPHMALGVRPDASLTRLNVASDRPNDGTWRCRLGWLARDGVIYGGAGEPANCYESNRDTCGNFHPWCHRSIIP